MITVDAPISFLVGSGLVYACRKDRELPGRDRLFARGLLFQSTILTPIILFFMLRFPDWEWNYMFDAQRFFFEQGGPTGFVILTVVVALINLSFVAGFWVGERLIREDRAGTLRRVLLGTGALIGAIMAVMYRQTLHLGSYAEFAAGQARLIFTHLEFLVVQGVAGLLIGGALFWIVRNQPVSAEAAGP